MEKFGKPYAPLLRHKHKYFSQNAEELANSKRIGAIYSAQPLRTECKNCLTSKPSDPASFTKQDLVYWFCDHCGHVNGAHDDTEAFCAQVYTGSGSVNYARNYSSEDQEAFFKRRDDIYVPKAEFLRDVLEEEGLDPMEQQYADIGAGSGYFVSALHLLGMQYVVGYDVSLQQVEHGNALLGSSALQHMTSMDLERSASTLSQNIITFIGVIEHLRRPTQFMKDLGQNPSVTHVLLSVPLMSPAVFLEVAFQDVFHRHFAGRHTHCYNEQSLTWLARESGFEECAAWWFGSDLADIYRMVYVTMLQQQQDARVIEKWSETFLPVLDEMQKVIDKKKIASEVHLVLRKRFIS
jgi:2-polyprenyl-3-methyl-5-hydroxy-6-metoxy-1,4-benzoquinol methylase